MQKKTKKKLVLLGLLLMIGALFFWLIKKGIRINNPEAIMKEIFISKSENMHDPFSEEIIIVEEGNIQKINLTTGEKKTADQVEQRDFNGFLGLPSLGFLKNEYLEISEVLFSKNKTMAIVRVVTYEKGMEEFVDPDAVKKDDVYICEIFERKCSKSDIFSQKYDGLDISQKEIHWTNWDSESKNIFGNFVDQIGENTSLYRCNTDEKKCNKVGERDENSYYEVPTGAVSPTTEKVIVIKKNKNSEIKAELLLFSSSDFSNPVEKINISSLINNERDGFEKISSIAWSKIGKNVAIGMDGGIFMLDMEKKSLSLIYAVPMDEESNYFWNSDELYLSPDESFVSFIDSDDWIEDDEEDMEFINNLKKINLDTEEISTIYSAKGLTMQF
ncbi:MAG: hypothetical protein ACD_5C00050G0006 [uncultured bacterium]|nr:MAG: hypothetical protein ACD_5C00050G0006 [uncultured bacterium]